MRARQWLARGRPQRQGRVPMGAASDDLAIVRLIDPGAAVGRRTLMILVPGILDPFPDIARHVIQAEGVSIDSPLGPWQRGVYRTALRPVCVRWCDLVTK